MKRLNRRSFLTRTALATAAVSWTARSWSQVAGSNSDVRVSVVGFGGRGQSHLSEFGKMSGVRITSLCDVDSTVMRKEVDKFAKAGKQVTQATDIRKVLEDKNVDVVSIATPNHWHSLSGIWAIQAGKDVYVEKPVSHNVFEGRQFVEAARKYKKIVQTGTQSRSSRTGIGAAVEWVKAGNLGKIVISRGLCYKPRPSIGKVDGPQTPPADVNYDLWSGPAEMLPIMRQKFHYDWHWIWAYGNGDLGNQGIHQMDIARWFMGENALSPKVWSVGGRLGYVDDGETPNTMFVMHEYEKAPLIFEVRGLPAANQDGPMDKYRDGFSVGVYLQYENGHIVVPDYNSAGAFGKDGKMVARFGSFPAPKDGSPDPGKPDNAGQGSHHENWAKSLRSRKPEELTGNISYLTGKKAAPGEILEKVKANKEATDTYERMTEHLKKNGVDVAKDNLTLGEFLTMDPKTEKFTNSDAANKLLTRNYRAPFVVPEKV
jgi:predicted dehydrogenase